MLESLTTHPNASQAAEALEALEALDETIHQKVRMGIMSLLLALGEADFKLLRDTLSLSDGNLSTHLALLEERGYVLSHKEFVRRKPRTTYTPTEIGRVAFQQYVMALERIVRSAASASLALPLRERIPANEVEPSRQGRK
jgi:DNA-binding HxlR family transcriptional regulator